MSDTEDILQPVPAEKWPEVQEMTKLDWPDFAYYYYWVQNAIEWYKQNPNFPIKIFCPNGDYKSGTFVGMSAYSIYIVLVFTQESTCETLKRCIRETKRIDWNQFVYYPAMQERIAKCMYPFFKEIEDEKGVYLTAYSPCTYYFKSAEECKNFIIEIPKECYLKDLDKSHVSKIHKYWPNKDKEYPELSTKYLTEMIVRNKGVGLFLKSSDELVSWILNSDWMGLGMVQTVDEYQGRGYAPVVTKALSKYLGEKNISSTLFVVRGNLTSSRMFERLGFRPRCQVFWGRTKPKDRVKNYQMIPPIDILR